MCTLQAHMQCYDRFFEVYSKRSRVQRTHFRKCCQSVIARLFRRGDGGCEYYFFSSCANGDCNIVLSKYKPNVIIRSCASLPDPNEYIELSVENKMCSILMELFGSVIVDSVTFIPSPWDHKYAHSSAGRV